jgi:hypothetical protein
MIRLLRNFASLSARHRALVLRAAAWLLVSRAALALCSLSFLLRWWPRIPAPRVHGVFASAAECELAVARASRVIPAKCLAQAFAGAALLRRERRPATLTIHVGFDDARKFEAHALLRSDSVVVTGDGPATSWPVVLRADLAQ